MTLSSQAVSDRARYATKLLAEDLRGKPKAPSRKYLAAMEALLGDLLSALSFHPPRPCYRPLSAGSFSGCGIGYKVFIAAFNDLLKNDFISVKKGRAAFGSVNGHVSRIRATTRLTEYLRKFGICTESRSFHFSSRQPPKASNDNVHVYLKTSSKRINGKKVLGKRMKIDWTNDRPIFLNNQLIVVNDFLSGFELSHRSLPSGGLFNGLYRSFNLGDDPDFDWNKGGRIYTHGSGYQSLPEDQRRHLLINGEATCEIDVSGCHITILHGQLKTPLPNRIDLYDGCNVPRAIMKDYVNLAIGSGKFPGRWTPEHKEQHGADLQKQFPIGQMKDKALALLPVLREWEGKGISWADLQYTDSIIVMDAIEALATTYNVPAYPVHDSIVVPISSRMIAEKQLSESFFKYVGLKPTLKLK